MEININMTLGEILQQNEKFADILSDFGMHCLNCPMCQMETLGEAIQVHELDVNEVLNKLNSIKE